MDFAYSTTKSETPDLKGPKKMSKKHKTQETARTVHKTQETADVTTVTPVATQETPMNIVLTLDTKTRVGANAVYSIPGYRGLVYFPVSVFANGAPETITLDGVTLAAPKVPAAKLSPEERKAAAAQRAAERKAETPAQKAERAAALARKAAERAAKLAEAAAKA